MSESLEKKEVELPKLSKKVQMFVDRYIANGCQGKAKSYRAIYQDCKKSTANAAANRLLRKPEIQEYISLVADNAHYKAIEKYDITVDRVYQELTRMSYYNAKDFFHPKTKKLIHAADLPDDLARAIAQINPDGSYKLADKGQNLDRLAKALNMYQTDQKMQQVVLVNAPTITKPRKTGT